MKDADLKGTLNISNVSEELEREVISFQRRFGIGSKAQAAKMLLREGAAAVNKRKSLRIVPMK